MGGVGGGRGIGSPPHKIFPTLFFFKKRYNTLYELRNIMFDEVDINDIQRYSTGLSEEEVLDIFGYELSELGADDLKVFNRAFKKGRALGKHRAVEALFDGMEGADAVKGALSYLVRVGAIWPQVEDSVGDGGFNFNLIMHDDTKGLGIK